MVDKNSNERIEILKFISQTHRLQFDQRREYEWKTLFSTLSVYGLSAAAKLAGNINIPGGSTFKILVWAAFGILAIISSTYLYHIHRAHQTNKGFAEEAEKALMKISGVSELKKAQSEAEKRKARRPWSLIWQLMTIFIFAVASAFIITYEAS
jgi:hypothetical protein